MHITLTNTGAVALPYVVTTGPAFAIGLDPGDSVETNDASAWVTVAGDKPSLREEFTEALKGIAEVIGRLLTFWREHHVASGAEAVVSVRIENHGPNALRVILGDNTNDHQVEAGASYEASAPGFVEVRELGV